MKGIAYYMLVYLVALGIGVITSMLIDGVLDPTKISDLSRVIVVSVSIMITASKALYDSLNF